MMRSYFKSILSLALIILLPFSVAIAQEVDLDAVQKIRAEGLENSNVMEFMELMTDVYGPRLTGSPELEAASHWAMEAMREMGLENVHLEEWGPFGLGWSLDHFSIHASSDMTTFPVIAYPKAWSPGTDGVVTGQVVYLDPMNEDDRSKWEGNLSDKIVLLQELREVDEWFEPLAGRHDDSSLLGMANDAGPRAGQGGGNFRSRFNSPEFQEQRRLQQEMVRWLYNQDPIALLDRGSKGDYGTIFVSSASVAPPETPAGGGFGGGARANNPGDAKVLPQATLAVEHYNRIFRLLERGVPVEIEMDLRVTFVEDDPMEYNVIGEIPGTDPEIGDEVVMIGAHFDSWHAGTGATDNASGSSVMMEAMRILSEVFEGSAPRRTIRIGLWTGEEQGLLGSRAYVNDHFAESAGRGQPITALKPEHEKFSAYYNFDNGTGKIRGVYLQGNESVAPIFREWLTPFNDLGASTLTLRTTGGTDHLSFDGVGLPGFQFIQEPIAYSSRTHHSNMDVLDHAIEEDLRQAATIISAFVYHTAQRDELLPRKEMTPPPGSPSSTSIP